MARRCAPTTTTTGCRFCGLLASGHQVPGDDGPVYQATHVAWPDFLAVTTAEAEAAIYVELEAIAMKSSQ